MKLLIVTATLMEVAPLVTVLDRLDNHGTRLVRCTAHEHDVDVLTTGVGMVATATWTSRTLAAGAYEAAINLGLCGSFDPALPVGCVVHVSTDCIAELGAEDGDRFLTVHELGLLGTDEFPFAGGRLVNQSAPPFGPLHRLTEVHGITVNTVHGSERSIAAVAERFSPQVESMEGAAFLYSCLTAGVRCAQVRAVSNRVERRDRSAWNLPLAVKTLNDTALAIVSGL
jgi:futalosine hydrolase